MATLRDFIRTEDNGLRELSSREFDKKKKVRARDKKDSFE
jgi:hypothetical protein